MTNPADDPARRPLLEALRQEIDLINCLKDQALRCVDAILRVRWAATFYDEQGGLEALRELQAAVNEAPETPLDHDPFSGADLVEVAGVVETSAHAAAFALARRTWEAATLQGLGPPVTVTKGFDEKGEPFTRITSTAIFQAPTEIEWSADVWERVRQQLHDRCEGKLDHDWMNAARAREMQQAKRRLEERFGVIFTADACLLPTAASAGEPAATEHAEGGVVGGTRAQPRPQPTRPEGAGHTDQGQGAGAPLVKTSPPDRFHYGRAEVKDLSKPQWRLFDALCRDGRLLDAVPILDVVAHVYEIDRRQEKRLKDKLRALDQLIRRTRRKLSHDGMPLELDQTNETLRLLPV